MNKLRVGNKKNSFLNGEWAGHVRGTWKRYTSKKRRREIKEEAQRRAKNYMSLKDCYGDD